MERKQQLWFWQITKNIGEAGDKSALLLLTKIAAPSPIPLRMLTLIAALLVGVAPALAASAVVEPTMPSQKTVVDLVQQGKAFYEAGQFAEAAKVLQPAAETFKNQGDRLQQAIALSNLSLAYQQLGQWTEATRAIAASLQILQTGSDRLKLLAQALDVQGRLQFSQGQLESALSTWQQAATTYSQAGDDLGSIRAQINQAQVQQAQGLSRRALETLKQVNNSLQDQPDSSVKAAALRSLGNTMRLIGDLEQSKQILAQSWAIAQRLQSPQDTSAVLLSLGNTARAGQKTQDALAYYQQAAIAAPHSTTKIQAQLNQLSLLVDTQQWPDAQQLWPQIESQLPNLLPSRTAIDARINLAGSLMKLSEGLNIVAVKTDSVKQQSTNLQIVAAKVLAIAVQQSKNLGDPRAQSFALGQLGSLYEMTHQWSEAIDLTQQSLILAQSINAPDIAYRWQWQLGRLLKEQGEIDDAILAYEEAVKNLKSLRTDLASVNPDVQFSFRESVEPVYRQLVSLLLQSQETGTKTNQKNLSKAREVIESLQLAELTNFFRTACLNAKEFKIDNFDIKAAVFYPIILQDRLEVILSIPGEPLRHYRTKLPQSEVEKTAEDLRKALVTRTSQKFLPLSQKLYDWMIRPAAADLAKSQVKTLVFVLDGPLRSVPMAALYDGKKYLVEEYAIALTPGLQLLSSQNLDRKNITALIAGLTEAREFNKQSFSALPNVALELQQVKSEVSGESLLNEAFTGSAIQNAIQSSSFPIVHLATHGQFSSKAEDTFILTWDDRLNVNQLNSLLQSREQRQPIELLILSACQTAAGDKRAALGLAGVAVRAGARSTLATLWYVDDAATAPLMAEFYKELSNASVSKAEALRRAQLNLLKERRYQHPLYWAPYVLIGNWL